MRRIDPASDGDARRWTKRRRCGRPCALAASFVLLATGWPACASRARSDTGEAGAPPAPSFGGDGASFPEDASLPTQARYVLGGCVGGAESACHGLGAGGMVLPDGTPSNLVGVPSTEAPALLRVKRGDPANSYLYRKVNGGPAIDGGRMPLDQPPLDDRSIRTLAAWIEAGAPAP